MSDGYSRKIAKPTRRSRQWTSFVGIPAKERIVRGLQEEGNPEHRVRVEHNQDTLLIHVSDERGAGWTTMAIDRTTREWSVAQRTRQLDAAMAAVEQLYK